MGTNKLEPVNIITITTNNIWNIPVVVTTISGNILATTHIDRIGLEYHTIRQLLKIKLDELIIKYSVDTILLEQNQLFIDKIEKYPDPYVLRNVKLGFGIDIMIEDNFWEKVKYIISIPRWEWKKEVLNNKVEYAIDLYKNHILLRQDIESQVLKEIDENNYYEALCLSESMLHSKFLHKKYQVNI